MALFILLFLCIYFNSIALAASYTDIASRSSDDIARTINATVVDHAGTDITSAFDVMVFYDTSAPSNITSHTNETKAASNTTDSLIGRRTPFFSRQITQCITPGTTFISSMCTPTDKKPGSLQAYTIICHRHQDMYHPYTTKFLYTMTFPVRRGGHCQRNELCLNGGSPTDRALNGHGIKVASCVQQTAFQKMSTTSPLGLKLDKQSLLNELEGKRLHMLVSKPDQSTPIEVDTFDVEAEVAGNGDTASPGTVDKCRDCMDLETQQFKKGTESLKAGATMLSTGAIAGVLWLAVMSG